MAPYLIAVGLLALVLLVGLRRRGFAWIYDRVQVKHAAFLAQRKPALLEGLRGTVLEIGPGTGVNLPFFDPSITWMGVEPNPHMRKRLEIKARKVGIEPKFRGIGSAATNFRLEVDDASVDAVVSTLVQCSVPDPNAFLSEVRRVLVPGGRFVFIDHVAAERGTWLRRKQNLLRPVAQFMADGCCPNREIAATVRAAGFSSLDLEEFVAPPDAVPSLASPHIAGTAIK